MENFALVGDHYFLPVVAHPHPDLSEIDMEEVQGIVPADHHQ